MGKDVRIRRRSRGEVPAPVADGPATEHNSPIRERCPPTFVRYSVTTFTSTRRAYAATLALLLIAAPLFADGPADNLPDKIRRVPPPGIAISEVDRAELQAGVDALGKEIVELRTA